MATDLRLRRDAAGLSQQKLAQLADCSIQMVRLLEQGLRPAQSDVLLRVEQVLAAHGTESNTNPARADEQSSALEDAA